MSGLCGSFSFDKKNDITDLLEVGLYALQHRGQEGFGITTMEGQRVCELKRKGMLSEVLNQQIIEDICGSAGIGFVKYLFSHNTKYEPMMPFVYQTDHGNSMIALDGTILNRNFNFCELVNKINGPLESFQDYMESLKGTYNLIYIDEGKMLIARDPYGIKPMCFGKLQDTFIAVSESCALDAMNGEFLQDVEPGAIVLVENGDYSVHHFSKKPHHLCLFEMIYIARHDSIIDGVSVYQARYKTGERLYEECPTEADIVIGSPDSGLIAAKGYAKASGIPFVDGILKNRYIQRTFIKPTQEERVSSVNIKLNAIKENLQDKRVILVDDSIVRGTTMKRIIKILKDAGAKEVHIRVASPKVLSNDIYAIDIPEKEQLIGYNKTVEEIRDYIGCDSLYYLSLEGLEDCCGNKGYYEKYFTGEDIFREEAICR